MPKTHTVLHVDDLQAMLKSISRQKERPNTMKERVWELECQTSMMHYALCALVADMKRRRRKIPDLS